MNLTTIKRKAGSKKEISALRREGFIPAVLYVKKAEGETLAVKSCEFNTFLRQVRSGHLPTTLFTLVDESGKERRVIVKDIQYEITSYAVKHLDFEELVDDQKVNVKVPIECVGAADSVGVKQQGGVVRQVIRHAKIRCYPNDLPSFFELDVQSLHLKQSKRISDLVVPENIRLLQNLNEVVVVLVKR